MKTKFLIFLTVFSIAAMAQENKLVWDYPVKPGSKEWAAFNSGQEMVDACQIPEKVLSKLTTQELAAICLNYPLFFDYTASNEERTGIKYIIESFNGLKELSKRKDGTIELIKIYNEFPVLTTVQLPSSKDFDTPYKLPFLELLIADDVFIKQLNDEQLWNLRKIVLKKYVEKAEHTDVYSLHNIKKTFLLGAVVLDKQSYPSISEKNKSVIKQFISTYDRLQDAVYTEISKIIIDL